MATKSNNGMTKNDRLCVCFQFKNSNNENRHTIYE